LNITDIARVESAGILIHGLLKLFQLIKGLESGARQLKDAVGMCGPEGGQLGQERCLVLGIEGRGGLIRLMRSGLRGAEDGTREVGVGGGVCMLCCGWLVGWCWLLWLLCCDVNDYSKKNAPLALPPSLSSGRRRVRASVQRGPTADDGNPSAAAVAAGVA
jgi:hypothetical protein